MTAYRYVRTGRLPAHKSGGVWRVRAADLDLLDGEDPVLDRVERLAERLAADDEPGSLRIADEARSTPEPWRLHGELLAPALLRTRVDGLDSTAARRAGATMLRLLGRLAPLESTAEPTGTSVVVFGPEHDHDLPAVALVADLLRVAGHQVIDLGPHTPADVVAQVIAELEPDSVVAVTERGDGVRLSDLIPQPGRNARYPWPRPMSDLGGDETAPATLFGPPPAESGNS